MSEDAPTTDDAALVEMFASFYGDEYYDEFRTIALADDAHDTVEVSHSTLADVNADLADDLVANPEKIIPAMHDAIDYIDWDDADEDAFPPTPFVGVDPLVTDLDDGDIYDVGIWDPNAVAGTFVGVRGQVTKRSPRKLRDDFTAFVCDRCGTVTEVKQTGDALQEPYECSGCERQGPFTVNDARSIMSDYQRIRLQSLPENTDATATEQVDVELEDHLVGQVSPGDRVIVNGIVRTERVRDGGQKKRSRELYLDAHSIEKMDTDHSDIDVEPYRDDVEELADDADVFEKLVNSVAPGHRGDTLIKKALLLMLFGGVEKELPDGSTKRGNSHILLIGDPGTGKSMLIKWVANLVGRAEYANGKQTTAAGLTATAVQDDFGGNGWTLEAGTLVRAHNGIACIDELDKMDPDDRGGMIEAMSDQKISISKAASGTLPAKTTVVAAANPKYGRFDGMDDIGEQLDLDPVLLSRFDLWFAMQDEPDEDRDQDIAEHINTTSRAGQKRSNNQSLSSAEKEAVEPDIDPDVLRAYISIGRDHTPVFTDDSMDLIADNYVELRQENDDGGPVPTTARTIEGVHRLSEASARIRLSDDIETEDVERAIAIRDYCMETMGADPESGDYDAMIQATGAPQSQHDRTKRLKGVIKADAADFEDDPGVPEDYLRQQCIEALGFDEQKFEHTKDRLSNKGEIYEPRTGYWDIT